MNKLLVGIIAATIIGGMAFMQPTEAQAADCGPPVPAGTIIAINDRNIEDYLCHMYFAVDPDWKFPPPGCLSCPPDNELDYSIIDQLVINEYRTLVLSDKLDTLSDDVNSISDNVQDTASNDVIIIIIIISLLCVSIGLGAANLARKR